MVEAVLPKTGALICKGPNVICSVLGLDQGHHPVESVAAKRLSRPSAPAPGAHPHPAEAPAFTNTKVRPSGDHVPPTPRVTRREGPPVAAMSWMENSVVPS